MKVGMNSLKNLLVFYIESSIHVALGVVALLGITVLHFDISTTPDLLLFVFFGTITGYNFVKYAGIAKLHHRSLAKDLKLIQIFSFLCFLALCYYTFQVKPKVLWVAVFMGVFTLLYALPIFSGKRNLRSIAGLKVYVIAFIWAGVTVLFPLVQVDAPIGINLVIEFFQRFLFVLILILPFEIRDLKYDPENLKTIPQKLGVKRTKLMGYILIMGWVLLELVKNTANSASIAANIFAAMLTTFAIYKSSEDQSPFFASFWIEGIPVIWFLALLLFSNFEPLEF